MSLDINMGSIPDGLEIGTTLTPGVLPLYTHGGAPSQDLHFSDIAKWAESFLSQKNLDQEGVWINKLNQVLRSPHPVDGLGLGRVCMTFDFESVFKILETQNDTRVPKIPFFGATLSIMDAVAILQYM